MGRNRDLHLHLYAHPVIAESRRRVLVIEDDPETGEQLVESLAASGYQVDLAVSGNEGLSHGLSSAYAVVTIDRLLPGIDGIEIIRRLREDGITTPALIISALGEVDDRMRGLRAGGDDYLVKPFAFAELLARLEALARRSATVLKETVLRVAAAACVGLAFGPYYQHHRRLCRARPPQDRQSTSLPAHPHRTGRRVLYPCS